MSGPREYTTAADASAHAAAVTEEWRRHRVVCSTCHRLRGGEQWYCDTGWEMAKTIARARSEARRLTHLAGTGQDALF